MRKLIGCCCAGFAAICCAQTPDESSVVMGSPAAVVAAKDGDIRTESAKFEIPILPDEYWWGGEVLEGLKQPFHAKSEKYAVDMRLRHGVAGGNQAAPVLMSSKGRWIWCEQAFKFAVVDGTLVIETEKAAPIATGTAKDGTLRGAFREVSGKYFPPKGHCRLEFFENPIFNTWIALKYNQNEKEILELGQEYIDNGMTPGVYMIDHTWHGDSFGDWNFHQGRFKDPKGMVAKLKKMGYTAVMLWFDPHISTDTALYRMMRKEKMLLMKKDGWTTAESYWWPGKASILDCTNPKTFAWLKDTCNRLMKDFDCAGFFFDAGDAYNYPMEGVPFVKDATPSDQVKAFHMIGMDVPFQQHRASWKMGGLPLMQTLRDKHPTYEAIHQCIADGIVSGLLGYPYVTFDMVGGGTVSNFEGENFKAAQDHFVRSMQVHALSPMVQFSLSPWRVLDARHQEIVRAMLRLRQTFVPYIVACVKETGRTGEPMMRSLEYNFPGHGYETITDQFMMGEKLLVAPQVVKDAVRRKVVIPPGTWTADDGQVYVGPKTVEIATPLARLPHFVRGEEGAAGAPAPNYWCTWATQGSTLGHNAKAGKVAFAGDQGVPRQRDNLNEEVLFGADGWARRFYPNERGDLYLLLDAGWDLPYGTQTRGADLALRGACVPDAARFPSLKGTPAERLKALNAKAKSCGWRGIGVWLPSHTQGETPGGGGRPARLFSMEEMRKVWTEKLLLCRAAGVCYWKVDWGLRSWDCGLRGLMTELKNEIHPALTIEHCWVPGVGPLNGVRISRDGKVEGPGRLFGYDVWAEKRADQLKTLAVSDVFRTYDVIAPFGKVTTLERCAYYSKLAEERKLPVLLNVEDEPLVGVGLGHVLGLMSPGSAGTGIATNDACVALAWQKLAPPFGHDTAAVTRYADEALEDVWTYADDDCSWFTKAARKTIRQSAPAVVTRGLPLPTVKADGPKPFVCGVRHPNGALALSFLPRTVGGRRGVACPADVTLDAKLEPGRPLGLFGAFKSVTLKGGVCAGARIQARQLPYGKPRDVTALCRIAANGAVVVPEEILEKTNASYTPHVVLEVLPARD